MGLGRHLEASRPRVLPGLRLPARRLRDAGNDRAPVGSRAADTRGEHFRILQLARLRGRQVAWRLPEPDVRAHDRKRRCVGRADHRALQRGPSSGGDRRGGLHRAAAPRISARSRSRAAAPLAGALPDAPLAAHRREGSRAIAVRGGSGAHNWNRTSCHASLFRHGLRRQRRNTDRQAAECFSPPAPRKFACGSTRWRATQVPPTTIRRAISWSTSRTARPRVRCVRTFTISGRLAACGWPVSSAPMVARLPSSNSHRPRPIDGYTTFVYRHEHWVALARWTPLAVVSDLDGTLLPFASTPGRGAAGTGAFGVDSGAGQSCRA